MTRDRSSLLLTVSALFLLIGCSWFVLPARFIDDLTRHEQQTVHETLGPDARDLTSRITNQITQPVLAGLAKLNFKHTDTGQKVRRVVLVVGRRIAVVALWVPIGILVVVIAGLGGLSSRAAAGAGLGYPSPTGFQVGKWCLLGAVIVTVLSVLMPYSVTFILPGGVILLGTGITLLGRNLPGRI